MRSAADKRRRKRQLWRTSVSRAAIPAPCLARLPRGITDGLSSMPSSIEATPCLASAGSLVIEQAHQLAGQRRTNHKGNRPHSRTRHSPW